MERRLVLDTSARQGLVALAEGSQVLATVRLEAATRRAGDLASVMQRLLAEAGWTPRQLTHIVCGLGPGSFTGLRVGLASAKALAYAVGCEFIGVETFAAIAGRTEVQRGPIAIIADGLQGQLFARAYIKDDAVEPTTPLGVYPLATWLATLADGTQLSGPGCSLLNDEQRQRFTLLPVEAWEASAEALLAACAWPWACERDVWRAEPFYLRGSSAEEKRQSTLSVAGAGSAP